MKDDCLQKGDIVVIGTKVKREDKIKLKLLAKLLGTSRYQLLQDLLLYLLRNYDRQSNISTDHETLVKAYLNLLSEQHSSYLATVISNNIKKAIFFISRKRSERPQMISVGFNEDGTMTESYNANEIIEDVLASIDTKLLDDLNEEKQDLGQVSIIDTIRTLLEPTQDDRMHEAFAKGIDEMFADLSIETIEQLADTHYQILQTKVKRYDRIKIEAIANHLGTNLYYLNQSLLLLLLQYYNIESDISTDHETIIQSYLNLLEAKKYSFSPIQTSNLAYSKIHINKAIFFISRKRSERPQMISVGFNEDGTMTESYNANEIIEDVLASIDTKLLDDLNEEKQDLGQVSIIDTIRTLLESTQDDRMHEEISKMFTEEIDEMFADLSIETFEQLADTHYKRKHYKSIDGVGSYTHEAAKAKRDMKTWY